MENSNNSLSENVNKLFRMFGTHTDKDSSLKGKFIQYLQEKGDGANATTFVDLLTNIPDWMKQYNGNKMDSPFTDPQPLKDSSTNISIVKSLTELHEQLEKKKAASVSSGSTVTSFDLPKVKIAINRYVEFLNSLMVEIDWSSYEKGAINKIYYGAPGTGKSFKVSKDYPNFKRVTFHPEYTHYDFVGGLRPVEDEITNKISYRFVPGPFTDALASALLNPNQTTGIIIEEVNRANTAAVFGDIFQLLDRDDNGTSEYSITNKDLQDYLRKEHNLVSLELKLPSNFSLIATMNSADQGVYVMDSAFKRRWKFEYMPINFQQEDLENLMIAGFNVPWSKFGVVLNNRLSNIGVEEDKLIGQRFISKKDLSNQDNVASKLLIYLWDDVVRYQREKLFSETLQFSKLVELYKTNPSKIFVPEIAIDIENLKNDSNITQVNDLDTTDVLTDAKVAEEEDDSN